MEIPALLVRDDEYNDLRDWTKDYIDRFCIVRNRDMPGKIPGSRYTWMFYLRNGLFNHEFLSAISQMFVYKIEREVGNFDFQLAGLETGSTAMLAGIPIISRVFNLNINAFSVRKEQKEYGLLNWIEGIPNDKPVMLIDDLCNSSASLKKCHDIVCKHGMNVLKYSFSIVNKVNKNIHSSRRKNTDMYLPEDIKMIYLFDLDDFNLSNPSH